MTAIPEKEVLQRIYGAACEEAAARYRALADQFAVHFDGAAPDTFFSSPGRTEIIGNHVDHNGGKVLAASITLDTICAVKQTDDDTVRIISEGYPDPIIIALSGLHDVPKCQGTLSLTAGLIEGLQKKRYPCHGFFCYISTNVIPSAGVSSSASYEMLIATVISELFHDGQIALADRALAGQYAENIWWDKASGLMDQMACAHGGTVLFDFADGVHTTPLDFLFDDVGCDMILVNSGQGHADLSAEYSSIPNEMRMVAHALGKDNLCESDLRALLSGFSSVRKSIGCDRALLRALHYYTECARVEEAADAIAGGHPEKLLQLITASGNSSWKWLQSCFITGAVKEQPVAVMLALTETFIAQHKEGYCRINGGGFGGVMMCVLPKALTDAYVDYMTPFAGKDHIHVMGIRKTGAVKVA